MRQYKGWVISLCPGTHGLQNPFNAQEFSYLSKEMGLIFSSPGALVSSDKTRTRYFTEVWQSWALDFETLYSLSAKKLRRVLASSWAFLDWGTEESVIYTLQDPELRTGELKRVLWQCLSKQMRAVLKSLRQHHPLCGLARGILTGKQVLRVRM